MAYCASQPYLSPLRYATTIALCIFSVGMSPILSTGRGANFRLEKIFGTRIVPIVHVQHTKDWTSCPTGALEPKAFTNSSYSILREFYVSFITLVDA